MIKRTKLCGIVAVMTAIILTAATSHAQIYAQTSIDDVEVRVIQQPITNAQRSYGYWEQDVILVNNGAADHRVTLQVSANSFGGGGAYLGELTHTYDLPAHSRREVSLLMPALNSDGGSLAVRVDGQKSHGIPAWTGSMVAGSPWRFGRGRQYLILLSPHVSEKVRHRLDNLSNMGGSTTAPSYSYSGAPNTVVYSDDSTTLAQWPSHWLGYSPYSAVVITASDLAALKPVKRRALWAYVRCGGFMLLLDGTSNDIPTTGQEQHGATVMGKRFRTTQYEIGFGICWLSPLRSVTQWKKSQWTHFQHVSEVPAGPLNIQTPQNANGIFPIIKNLGIPARGLLSILGIFAIVVGPVNLFVLSKLRRRLYLWFTTPAISLIFSLGVFGYAFAAEGWTAARRVTALTILDQQAHQATTIGWLGYYAPLTPSGGLHFGRRIELTAEVAVDTSSGFGGGGGSPCTVDWTRDQHLAAGWISARVPALFAVRKDAPSRARVTFSRDAAGNVTAVNGLGVDIQSLMYEDADGQVYATGPIKAGAKAMLSPSPVAFHNHPLTLKGSAGVHIGILRDVFAASNWPSAINIKAASPRSLLRPNAYVAQTAGCPFIQPGLEDAKQRPAPCLVVGLHSPPLAGGNLNNAHRGSSDNP